MRLTLAFALLLTLLLNPAASPAASRGLGLGATLGEPTGVTAKQWVDQDEAWTFGLGVNPFDESTVQGSADYVLHFLQFGRQFNLPELALYTGLGGRLNYPEEGHLEAGVRLPAGLSFFMDKNVEWFAELVPVFDFAPYVEVDLNAVVGVRFYGW
jgi:hypothetical protein